MPDPKTTTRGFKVPCLHCGEKETVRVSLDNLSAFTCVDCDAEFTADDVRAAIDDWSAVLAWIDTAPEV